VKIEFRNRLLLFFAPVIALALATTVLLSWQSARATVERNAERSLMVAEQIFNQLLRQSQQQLTDRAQLLSEDFGFRRAVATGETDTTISVLANHGGRAGADLMMLLSPDGEVVANTHAITEEVARELLQAAEAPLLYSEGAFYQIALAPVRAPDLIGWVVMGNAIDLQFAERIQQLALTDVTLLFESETGEVVSISTWAGLPDAKAGGLDALAMANTLERREADTDLLANAFTRTTVGGKSLYIVLSTSLGEALAAWRPWQRKLWLIGLVSLLVTALTAWVVALTVSKPIRALVSSANKIASGDYAVQPSLSGDSEFGFLEQTLQKVGLAVSEREERILHQARYDALTDLPTRQYLDELFSASTFEKHSLLLVKVRKQRELTEVYGMDWTDQLVAQVADQLQTALSEADVVARIARDQFVVWSENAGGEDVARQADTVANALKFPLVVAGIEVKVDLQMSAALAPEHGASLDDLLRRAVIAMSGAVGAMSQLRLYQEGEDLRLHRKLRVTQRLQLAILEGAFELHYQPKLSLGSRRVEQVEALLRWSDAELGKVFPDEFIPLAERSGDIIPLSNWVTREAALKAAAWRDAGRSVQVGVNVSGRDFAEADFVERTLATVRAAGATPDLMVLEVTESAMMEDVEQGIQHLERLRAEGFTLALDDFGTGFSSLSQLKHLPVDELKIDKSFVLNLPGDKQDLEIVRSTVELGHSLGMKVVAEGVENNAALQLLRQMGCDAIQGYHLSRPQPAASFEQWLEQESLHVRHAFDDAPTESQSVGL
jgi:diguanylate cyclase (GGDEF)-like protein